MTVSPAAAAVPPAKISVSDWFSTNPDVNPALYLVTYWSHMAAKAV